MDITNIATPESIARSRQMRLSKEMGLAWTTYEGRTSQCGEGWHSNEKTVRFWVPSPRVPKETDARCYAYTTPYTTMIPLCNVC